MGAFHARDRLTRSARPSSAGAAILAVAYILPFFYLLWSLRYGPIADDDPWDAAGLEWRTSSPPPKHNFETVPIVDKQAYCYPVGGRGEQSEPRTQKAERGDG